MQKEPAAVSFKMLAPKFPTVIKHNQVKRQDNLYIETIVKHNPPPRL